MIKISISRDFSNFPAGRMRTDGADSGQRFREDFLIPALAKGDLEITLDAEGYGSSFLEESFGGLIRLGHVGAKLRKQIAFVTDDPTLETEIWQYVDDAEALKNG